MIPRNLGCDIAVLQAESAAATWRTAVRRCLSIRGVIVTIPTHSHSHFLRGFRMVAGPGTRWIMFPAPRFLASGVILTAKPVIFCSLSGRLDRPYESHDHLRLLPITLSV